jgi:hypothetical protein
VQPRKRFLIGSDRPEQTLRCPILVSTGVIFQTPQPRRRSLAHAGRLLGVSCSILARATRQIKVVSPIYSASSAVTSIARWERRSLTKAHMPNRALGASPASINTKSTTGMTAQAVRSARRYAANPSPAKPSSIMAHVEGSGTTAPVSENAALKVGAAPRRSPAARQYPCRFVASPVRCLDHRGSSSAGR